MPLLGVVICSTRPGRLGPVFAEWFAGVARQQGAFDVELIDLAELNLPFFDEPRFPMLRQYEHAHTWRWSETVSRLDAVVFVTCEYNHGPPPAVINALSFLSREWAYMPAGFVSYGGLAGGARAIQALRLVTNTLRMMPVPESVLLPNVIQSVDPEGEFDAAPASVGVARGMLDELFRWANALAGLRDTVRGQWAPAG